MLRSFKDLDAWKESHKLAIRIYQETRGFPKEELFGLTSQMRRCAVSVPSNIAEGFNRANGKEKIQFYRIAHGSVAELQAQLLIAKDVKFIKESTCNGLLLQAELVHKIITGLIKSIK